MVLRRRAEVPQHRVAVAREERAAGALVARPLADVRARDIADVVLVEEQDGAELRVPEGRLRSLQPVAPKLREVDPLLPVDRHRRAARGDLHGAPSSKCSSTANTRSGIMSRQNARVQSGYRNF